MASLVESRRRLQLGGAVVQFLLTECPEAATVYTRDATSKGQALTVPVETDQLFKKWSATIRMQAKLDELERTVSQLQEQLRLFESASKFDQKANSFPCPPPISTLTGHRQSVTRIAFHPLVLLMASCSEDGLVLIWDYESGGNLIKTLRGHTGAITDIDFDSTGKLLATCSADTSVKLWDFSKFESLRTLNGHDSSVSAVKFLSGGDKVLSCSKDESIRLWDSITGYCLKTFFGHTDWVRTLAVAPHREYFATAGSDKMIFFWNIEDSNPVSQFSAHEHVVEWIVFANASMLEHLHQANKAPPPMGPAHGQKTHSSFIESSSQLQDTFTVSSSASPPILEIAGPVLFSASRDNTIKMWNPMEGVCLQQFIGHLNWVREISIHPSGLTLASCSDDRSIKAWNVLTGRCEVTIPSAHSLFVNCCRFGVKSAVLASGATDKDIRIWKCCHKPKDSREQNGTGSISVESRPMLLSQ